MKKIFGEKKYLDVKKNFCQNILVKKKIREKKVGQTKFLVKKNLVKKVFAHKKILFKKIFWLKTKFGPKCFEFLSDWSSEWPRQISAL